MSGKPKKRSFVFMEDPPWLPKLEMTRNAKLLALANCIHELHYRKEKHAVRGWIFTFHNMCAGDLERTASVLKKVGLTKFIDEFGIRSEFVCAPEGFKNVIAQSPTSAVSDHDIDQAIIRLGTGGFAANEEITRIAAELMRNS